MSDAPARFQPSPPPDYYDQSVPPSLLPDPPDPPPTPVPATSAVAGIPGIWNPNGNAIPPASGIDLINGVPNMVTPVPLTHWTTGQHVIVGDGTHMYWDSGDYIQGDAP